MDRKDFIEKTALLSAAGVFASDLVIAQMATTNNSVRIDKVGVQLFSLPYLLEKDFKAAIAMLSQMGYSEIELFGPYPYSADSAKERWKSLIPMLGFAGSGYFGRTEQEIGAILNEFNMTVPAAHTDLESLRTNMGELGTAGDNLGIEYVILPAIPEEERKTLDGYKRIAEVFNGIGAQAKSNGLKFAYHNHGYGLNEVDGQVPMQIILDNTDPDLVFFEMDLFWTIAGRADPITYLRNNPNRYHLMHVKDMNAKVHFSGDGSDAGQWMELFPHMTTAGDGVIDLEAIVPAAQEAGVHHFFVEQDKVNEPEIALKKSLDYLKTIK